MDYDKIIQLSQDQFKKLKDECDELILKQTSEDRNFTKEEQERFDAAKNGMLAIEKRIENTRFLAGKFPAKGDEASQRARTAGNDAAGRESTVDREEQEEVETKKRYARSFNRWIKNGVLGIKQEERSALDSGFAQFSDSRETRALSAVTGTTGGYLAPAEFLAQLEVAMKAYAGMLQAPLTRIPTSTGADLNWPTLNDTANEGEQIGENTAQNEGPDNVFGYLTLRAYAFSSRIILLPIELVEDAAINVEAVVRDMLAIRLGRILNRRFTTGNGASQPLGVVTGAAAGPTTAAASTVTYDNLVDLEIALDPAYWQNASYMMGLTMFGALRKLKDSDGRPIWQPQATSGLASATPGTINGKPYFINTNMAALAAGSRSLIYGDLSKYYVREVGGLTVARLTERYAEKRQIGYFATMRRDGRINNAGIAPVVALVQGA